VKILRGLGSRALACGCLVGLYETYASETIAIVDARGPACKEPTHQVDASISVANLEFGGQPPRTMPTMSR
jgi:hypothetical protein